MSALLLSRSLLRAAATSRSSYAPLVGAAFRHGAPTALPRRDGLAPALCSAAHQAFPRTVWKGAEHAVLDKREPKEIERIPLPAGVPTDKFRAYEISGSAGAVYQDETSEPAILTVHGPTEAWAPHGLVEGHGASGGIFAVIATGGNQFKVSPGDVLYTSRQGGEVNSRVAFESVLLVASVDWSVFGRPLIGDARVLATIEEQARSGKTYKIKFKKRTGYRRKKGHRQNITRFRIDEIEYKLPDVSRLEELEESENIPPEPERNLRFPLV